MRRPRLSPKQLAPHPVPLEARCREARSRCSVGGSAAVEGGRGHQMAGSGETWRTVLRIGGIPSVHRSTGNSKRNDLTHPQARVIDVVDTTSAHVLSVQARGTHGPSCVPCTLQSQDAAFNGPASTTWNGRGQWRPICGRYCPNRTKSLCLAGTPHPRVPHLRSKLNFIPCASAMRLSTPPRGPRLPYGERRGPVVSPGVCNTPSSQS